MIKPVACIFLLFSDRRRPNYEDRSRRSLASHTTSKPFKLKKIRERVRAARKLGVWARVFDDLFQVGKCEGPLTRVDPVRTEHALWLAPVQRADTLRSFGSEERVG